MIDKLKLLEEKVEQQAREVEDLKKQLEEQKAQVEKYLLKNPPKEPVVVLKNWSVKPSAKR